MLACNKLLELELSQVSASYKIVRAVPRGGGILSFTPINKALHDLHAQGVLIVHVILFMSEFRSNCYHALVSR